VTEWPDFQGFGFNVHTLRDKPGQYIGKVDADSPAAAAGCISSFISDSVQRRVRIAASLFSSIPVIFRPTFLHHLTGVVA